MRQIRIIALLAVILCGSVARGAGPAKEQPAKSAKEAPSQEVKALEGFLYKKLFDYAADKPQYMLQTSTEKGAKDYIATRKALDPGEHDPELERYVFSKVVVDGHLQAGRLTIDAIHKKGQTPITIEPPTSDKSGRGKPLSVEIINQQHGCYKDETSQTKASWKKSVIDCRTVFRTPGPNYVLTTPRAALDGQTITLELPYEQTPGTRGKCLGAQTAHVSIQGVKPGEYHLKVLILVDGETIHQGARVSLTH
jgi:hypothetical protein